MSREERIQAMKDLEKLTNSKVIVLFHSSRAGPFASAKMSIEQARYLYEHLKDAPCDKVSLLLYTLGGDTNAPLRLVQLIRDHCKNFEVLVPYRAHSAGTLVCLGADRIIMGKMGELSPIDPTTGNPFNPNDENNKPNKIPISVEDVTAYLNLSEEKYGIGGEDNKLQVFLKLADRIHPLALGNVYRKIQLIRLLARKLIELQNKETRPEPEKLNRIIEHLTEKLYAHDYFISRQEAKSLELNIVFPLEDVERAMWNLFILYEKDSMMMEPFAPENIFNSNIKEKRQFKLPEQLQFQIPQELSSIPPQVQQQIVQKIIQQVVPQIQDSTPINVSFPSAFIESTKRSDIHHVNAKITGTIEPSGKKNINIAVQLLWQLELSEE